MQEIYQNVYRIQPVNRSIFYMYLQWIRGHKNKHKIVMTPETQISKAHKSNSNKVVLPSKIRKQVIGVRTNIKTDFWQVNIIEHHFSLLDYLLTLYD